MSEPFMSEISLFGCNFAPRSWALCQGQLLSVTQYSALFSLLGTIYGGDGRTNFAVPNLSGRAAIGQGTGPGLSARAIGQAGGYETVVLTQSTMPGHTHTATAHASSTGTFSGTPNANATVYCNNDAAGETEPVNRVWGSNSDNEIYADSIGTENNTMHTGLVNVAVDMSPVTVDVTTTVDSVAISSTGSNMAHENMSPFLALTHSICTVGLYPPRN
ncbi:MAG: phage tail protein [bacterium]|nr:phage tail protein [bacterium]